MAREVIVKPLGLVTRPNLYGQYPVGGLVQAQNLVMRAPGILETAPATVLGASYSVANAVVHQLLSLPSAVMFSWVNNAGVWTVFGNTTASTTLPVIAPAYSTTGRITPTVLRDRIVVNSSAAGQYVCDPQDQTPPAVFRRAGFRQAFLYIPSQTATNAQALPLNCAAGYSAIFKRTYSDGYTLVSRPAPIFTSLNNGFLGAGPVDVNIRVVFGPSPGFQTSRGVRLGDVVEIYRTDIVPQATFDTDPGTTLKKIAALVVNATDVSNQYVAFKDSTVPGPLNVTEGEALYTNPGQQGALGANRFPEQAQCVATFKGFAFYANITQRPQLIFKAMGGISWTAFTGWDTAAFRSAGLGDRVIACVITNGSATVTGVSATQMLGVAIGQRAIAQPVPWPANTTVQSFNTGAGTITMTAPANAGAVALTLEDQIEINGTLIPLSVTNGNFAQNLAASGYELSTSENVYDNPPNTGLQKLITYIVEPLSIDTATPLTVRATNGQNYDPQLVSFPTAATSIPYKTYKNLLTWSKDSQPEHVPVPNNTFVGTGEIIALESTRDALWIFCTDGLFRLSGDGGQWRIDTVDTTCILSSPRASCVLRETVYAYTNQGFVRITDAGVEQLSERGVGDLLPGAEYTETASILLERNEAEDEIVIRIDATQVYVYSTRENAYTTVVVPDVTAMFYSRYPVSGNASLAFGRSPAGSAPRYELWNSVANWLAPIARFQPVFAQDPFAAKQWIDASFIFDVGSIGKSLTPAWNATGSPSAALKGGAQYVTESRAVFGVPRRAAIGNTLAPGFSLAALGSSTKLYALSLRYRQFGEQQLHR
jgi:hypothetical protein